VTLINIKFINGPEGTVGKSVNYTERNVNRRGGRFISARRDLKII
jgi:hypothetical protein